MKIDEGLIEFLINNHLQAAIHHFNQTQDQSKLDKETDYCIEQIKVCANTDTMKTIEKLLSSLNFKSELELQNLGTLKAIKLLKRKTNV